MRYLIIFLSIAGICFANDKYGTGINPLRSVALDETITLNFYTKSGDDELYYMLSVKRGEYATFSVSPGKGVTPDSTYVYFWDNSEKVFWFASGQFLRKHNLLHASDGETSSKNFMLENYIHMTNVPKKMKILIHDLLSSK